MSAAADIRPGDAPAVGVTGGGGKTGGHVVRALRAAGYRVRALVRHADGATAARTAGAEPVVGDMAAPADVTRLLAGCIALYHIPPNMSPDEQVMIAAAIEACRATGTPRLVYHSVLHPQTEAMPHHWAKLRVEERLLASGLEVVLCQPAPYMQNLLPYLARARETGAAQFPYGPDVTLSMVDLADVGAAAAQVVEGPAHVGGAYQLCAADDLTQGEAWSLLTTAAGLDVPFTTVDLATWRARTAGVLGSREQDWLMAMFSYYERYGLRGSSLPLEQLLGRQPRSFDAFARVQVR